MNLVCFITIAQLSYSSNLLENNIRETCFGDDCTLLSKLSKAERKYNILYFFLDPACYSQRTTKAPLKTLPQPQTYGPSYNLAATSSTAL